MAEITHEPSGRQEGDPNNISDTPAAQDNGVQLLMSQVFQRLLTSLSPQAPAIAEVQADTIVEPIRLRLERYIDDALESAQATLKWQVDEAFEPVSVSSRRYVDELLDPVEAALHEHMEQTLLPLASEREVKVQALPAHKTTRTASQKRSEAAGEADGQDSIKASAKRAKASPRGRGKRASAICAQDPSQAEHSESKASARRVAQSDTDEGLAGGGRRRTPRAKSGTNRDDR